MQWPMQWQSVGNLLWSSPSHGMIWCGDDATLALSERSAVGRGRDCAARRAGGVHALKYSNSLPWMATLMLRQWQSYVSLYYPPLFRFCFNEKTGYVVQDQETLKIPFLPLGSKYLLV